MFTLLPQTAQEITHWTWPQIEPYYQDLESRALTAENANDWLADWTNIAARMSEMYARLHLATNCDTTDAEAEQHFNAFLENIYPPVEAAEQKLRQKLLASGLEPTGFGAPAQHAC